MAFDAVMLEVGTVVEPLGGMLAHSCSMSLFQATVLLHNVRLTRFDYSHKKFILDMTTEHRHHPHFIPAVETHVTHVTPPVYATQQPSNPLSELCTLMREMLAAQDRQNELLEELVDQVGAQQRQRHSELAAWQQANPELANFCHRAAEKLSKIQTDYLGSITEEIEYGFENFCEGDFALSEFVDRFGPRFSHLNGLLHVLSQLGSPLGVADPASVARTGR